MRRDEIVEVVEVKPLTVADVPTEADADERAPADPTPRPHPVRA